MNNLLKEYSTEDFKNKYHYSGELGALYSKECTTFILWAPICEEVSLLVYGDNKEKLYKMNKGEKGVWRIKLSGDLKNIYYNYLVSINGKNNVVVDPYAKAVGINGEKSMVVDLESTNPNMWDNDKKPELLSATDAILYEMHIRDFSIDENSGVKEKDKGKYLGLVEDGTVIPKSNIKTTLDHLKELGITHVHLLPTFDYKSVDEKDSKTMQYNWGYDPQNYNAPEGSYSSNAFGGNVRIKEFKEAIKRLHSNGLRVVMDVVYNHTFDSETSCLNLAVPKYYHRSNEKGEFSNGSACGNELASERSMVRKYIVDSVSYWAKEYHIDGFRFDLMGLHDIETMKEIRKSIDKIDSSIIIYGEGWNGGGETPLPVEKSALKVNTPQYEKMQIACFSDDIRDGIKGDVFIAEKTGFVNGGKDLEETIKFGVVASIDHKDINYETVLYSNKHWANEPYQTINYDSAHDNYTLWDKLKLSSKNASEEELIKMNKLSAAIVLTSQGIPFLHAGEEFLRTKENIDKTLVENSYNSLDYVNKLDWNRKKKYIDVFNYYKGLIDLRRTYKEFRLDNAKEIKESIKFFYKGKEFKEDSVVAFTIKNKEEFIVIYNGNKSKIKFNMPKGVWEIVVDGKEAGAKVIKEITSLVIEVEGISTYVIKKKIY